MANLYHHQPLVEGQVLASRRGRSPIALPCRTVSGKAGFQLLGRDLTPKGPRRPGVWRKTFLDSIPLANFEVVPLKAWLVANNGDGG